MLVPTRHILPMTLIQRTRWLPVPGEILVRAGQTVSATDIIATAQASPRHMRVNVARGLGISPKKTRTLLQRDVGDDVQEGDVLAERGGLGKRVVRAPTSGRIVFVLEGQVLLQMKGTPYELLAGIPGTVAEIIEDKGVTIRATGGLVEGVWGNGRLGFGLMKVLAKEADHELTADQLDVSLRGAVILAGYCADPAVFRNAVEQQLRGLIFGGLSSALVSTARKMPFPVLVIEGLRQVLMNEIVFKLLSTNDNREVAINAEMSSENIASRPEVFIPLPGEIHVDLPADVDAVVSGKKVRITRAPYTGRVGTVTTLNPSLVVLPSGLRAETANVQIAKNEVVQVPLINLEVLG